MHAATMRQALILTRTFGGVAFADQVSVGLSAGIEIDGPALWRDAHDHPAFEAADDGTGRIALAAGHVPPSLEEVGVICADVGSISNRRFGWDVSLLGEALPDDIDQTLPSAMADFVCSQLQQGRPVALGLECPLFVPVPPDEQALGRARDGEGNRSWSAGAGTGALATGLVQTCWLLDRIRSAQPDAELHLDWDGFAASGQGLLLWEAFVSADAKGVGHVDDAMIAIGAFLEALPDPRQAQTIRADRPLSLAGAAALWSGWTTDHGLLKQPPLLVRA